MDLSLTILSRLFNLFCRLNILSYFYRMAKAKKQEKPKKERLPNYDEKLVVNGSFLDIMKAGMKDAENKSAKKKD